MLNLTIRTKSSEYRMYNQTIETKKNGNILYKTCIKLHILYKTCIKLHIYKGYLTHAMFLYWVRVGNWLNLVFIIGKLSSIQHTKTYKLEVI